MLKPTSVKRGGKNRRRGKNENESEKRELVFKEDGQEYAQVIKMLGNGRLEAQCFDGEKRLAHIRGKLRKKVWINQGDIILISLRDYQDSKADVILKYTTEEARNLKAYGELPENAKINETDTFGPEDEECNFEFDVDETFWGPPGHVPLRKKGMGLSLHVSDFLTEIDGRLKFEGEEAYITMKPGANCEGWWTSKHLVKQ
ncbi:1663_t:CDS:2, partial [Entrophospora sp. SA101]